MLRGLSDFLKRKVNLRGAGRAQSRIMRGLEGLEVAKLLPTHMALMTKMGGGYGERDIVVVDEGRGY